MAITATFYDLYWNFVKDTVETGKKTPEGFKTLQSADLTEKKKLGVMDNKWSL